MFAQNCTNSGLHCSSNCMRGEKCAVNLSESYVTPCKHADTDTCCIRSVCFCSLFTQLKHCDKCRVSCAIVIHLSPSQDVKCSARYLGSSRNSLLCSIGVYAAVAPYLRHNCRKASSDCNMQVQSCKWGHKRERKSMRLT